MGSHLHTYIGTYLKIAKLPSYGEKKSVKVATCKCFKSIDSKFCPNCGKPVETKIREFARRMSPYQMLEEIGAVDALVVQDLGDEETILTPNHRLPHCLTISEYNDLETEREVPDPEKSKHAFLEKYEKEMQKMMEMKIEVELKFGILCYWS